MGSTSSIVRKNSFRSLLFYSSSASLASFSFSNTLTRLSRFDDMKVGLCISANIFFIYFILTMGGDFDDLMHSQRPFRKLASRRGDLSRFSNIRFLNADSVLLLSSRCENSLRIVFSMPARYSGSLRARLQSMFVLKAGSTSDKFAIDRSKSEMVGSSMPKVICRLSCRAVAACGTPRGR